ncbi:MAG: YchJ family protein [Planctomycetota bacterium]
MVDPNQPCPCGAGRTYGECCQPYHARDRWPESPELLMRSRYSAFSAGEVSFLVDSLDSSKRTEADERELGEWARNSDWLGLEILETHGGGPTESDGTVEFDARYRVKEAGEEVRHRELASFKKRDGVWYFLDGKVRGGEPIQNEAPKVGRNDPCPCGSGRKFKKCCA